MTRVLLPMLGDLDDTEMEDGIGLRHLTRLTLKNPSLDTNTQLVSSDLS